jgi:hypothetical protein
VSITSTGLSCIASSQALAARSAAGLVQGTVTTPAGAGGVAGDIVSLGQAANGVAIGAKLVATGEAMTRTLLDLFA